MSVHKVELVFEAYDKYDDRFGLTVKLDGKDLAFGSYGGEPEDNRRGRDYAWVESALARLAKALGAEVTTTELPYDEER